MSQRTAGDLHPADIERQLETQRLGRRLQYFSELDSTNTTASELAEAGAAEGTVVIADSQRRGRGRLGRSWASPPGRNLYLSVVLRPPLPPPAAPGITVVAGLAAAETVRQYTREVGIKWPNDLVVRGRKLAGMLTEMASGDEETRFVILGIGVNLNSEPADLPPALRDIAISVREVTGTPVDRARFAAQLLSRLESRYDLFLREGLAPIIPLWEGYSCLTGEAIVVQSQEEQIRGTAIGLAGDGTLRVREPDGRERRVVAGEVTVVGGYRARAGETA
jgi:BirA family transcriptional regulator, biotin operon repressor / biotin---[acetyl-CoA-carboxylase] ligase